MWPCFDVENHCSYRPLEIKNAIITVTDPDANKFNGSIDKVKVFVWSDTDRKGIIINAFETHLSSGVFEGRVQISDDQSGPNKIHVIDGDTLAAKYIDTTLPIESKSDSLEVTASSFIGHTGPPLERVPASSMGVFDKDGNQVDKLNIDQQVQIRSDIANPSTLNQTFAYIVQIQGKNGFIESLGWLSGVLGPSQAFSPSVSWIPTRAGNYTVTVFVWNSINNPDALSPPISTDFIVLSNSSSQNFIGNDSNSPGPLSPLKQFKSGTDPYFVTCRQDLELVINPRDGSPACVKSTSLARLLKQGWEYAHDNNGKYRSPEDPKKIEMDPLDEKILSNTSYDQKIQLIQDEVNSKNLKPFSKMVLSNLKPSYKHGEKITFDLTVYGYHDWCLLPNLILYYNGYDKPIHEDRISHSCPAPYGNPYPSVSYWTNANFPLFPTCRYAGLHTIVGESFEFGPKALGQYYCNGKEKFAPPQEFELVIPKGASDPHLGKTLVPSELHVKLGDYIKFVNQDDVPFRVMGDSARDHDPGTVEFYYTIKPGDQEQTKIDYDGEYWIRVQSSPEEKDLSWLNATIHVD